MDTSYTKFVLFFMLTQLSLLLLDLLLEEFYYRDVGKTERYG